MNTSKEFRQWAKEQGLPMPRYMKVDALINDGEGSFLVWVRPFGSDIPARIEYLERLIAAARRAGKYARIMHYKPGMMTALFCIEGVFAEIDIQALSRMGIKNT